MVCTGLSREDLRAPVSPHLGALLWPSPDLTASLPFSSSSMGMVLSSLGMEESSCLCHVFQEVGPPNVPLGEVSSASSCPSGAPPRTVCDTHCSLSVAPVTVQEELVPTYFLPFLDHGFLFLFFFLSPPSFLSVMCVCVRSCVCVCVYVFLGVYAFIGYLKQQATTHSWLISSTS